MTPENNDDPIKPVKICAKHGDLYRDDVILAGFNQSGSRRLRCRACMKDLHARHYLANKFKVKEAHHVYKMENKEKVRQMKSISAKKHRHKYKDRENQRKKLAERIDTKELSDRYVKKILSKRSNLSMSDIPPALIEMGRAVLKFKRTMKRKKIDGENKVD